MIKRNKVLELLLLFIVLCVVASCKEEKEKISLLKDSLSYGNIYSGPMRFIPMRLHCRGTNDTIWSMVMSGSLYDELNMLFCDYDSFVQLLVDKVEKDGCLTVDSTCFVSYCQYAIVKNVTIDSIYQKKGIYGILENYVTKDGELAAFTLRQLDYLVFLLYQHRILCNLGPEPMLVVYVCFYATEKEKEYMKILESSKSIMHISPFYLSGKDSLEYINQLKTNGEGWKLK